MPPGGGAAAHPVFGASMVGRVLCALACHIRPRRAMIARLLSRAGRSGLMGDARAAPPRSSFARYWTAAAISSFGSAVTAVAMPVLVVQLLGATPFEVGVVNAAQFVPYALLGLIAGVYTDRWRRKPVLVWASVGRALSLGAIPILWLTGILQ